MYLKSIEVHGFKSFANKIVFDFHNGITGIVGPNGSGKSNVADAVRWVLGEQKVKQLRSSSMQDVIFAGTENRKPQSYAYVSITLDNSDHQLPLDYNEVTVARRVYRSGESEYLINGTSCRLKDVNELFYDTGIGKEGYSIIGQGQIDKILSGKPEERRELFDEAAGIVKFKRRKATAQKKLEDEQQNLIRVNDILSELERQVGPLERQAQAAKEYLRKREALKRYDANLFLRELERTGNFLRETEQKKQITEDENREVSFHYDQTRKRYEQMEQEMAGTDVQIGELQQKIRESGMLHEKLEGQINVLKEQIHTVEANKEHIRQRLKSLAEEIARCEVNGEKYTGKKALLDEQMLEIQKKRQQIMQKTDEIRKEIARLEMLLESGKKEVFALLKERASLKAEQQRYDTMLEQTGIRRAQLNQQLVTQKSSEGNVEGQLAEQKEQFHQITERIVHLEAKKTEMQNQRAQWRQKFDDERKKLEACKENYHKDASRLESLRNIAERYDGYGNSIRRVMERKQDTPGIHGVVADIIKVEKKYEVAIETALGGSLQNIVTDNETTAKQMIVYLKENRYGRATFLPLTSVSRPDRVPGERAIGEPGVIGLADTLVETKEEYRQVAGYLLGRTLVVDQIDHAIALQKKFRHSLRIVTLEGESLQPGGSMTGGAFRNNSNLLGRGREITALEMAVREYQEEAKQIRSRMEDIRTANVLLKDDLGGIQTSLQEQYLAQNTVQMNVEHMQAQKEQEEASFRNLRTEIQLIDQQKQEILSQKELIQEKISQSMAREEALGAESEKLEQQIQTENQNAEQLQHQLTSVSMEEAQLQQKIAFSNENIQRVEEERRRFCQERKTLQESSDGSSKQISDREEQIREFTHRLEQTGQDHEEFSKELQTKTTHRESLSSDQKQIFKEQEDLAQRRADLEKEMFRLNSQIEKIESERETLVNEMWSEYELTAHEAKEWYSEEFSSAAQLKQLIAQVKSEIRSLGNVNVNAIEEYQSVSERYEFLKTQHEDLLKAEETLQKIIEELDEGMRRQFSEKFADIQREFDKAFKDLFGGGKGTLTLTEGEDILECGVSITAQPPGKKLQNMMQLSGGEKALTAIALLFAIQNLKPSPFCLLDEIEAALDDSNVDRFAGYLHKLTKNTQFIIITHRRGTMNAADRLYGITMQEKGVSTLVSVSLIEQQLDN